MNLLKGKRVLVTGGASGIGAEIVKIFLTEGALAVRVVDKDADGLEILAESLQAGDGLQTFVCDLSKLEGVELMARNSHTAFADLDVVVNNAAIEMPFSFTSPDWQAFDLLVRTNVYGVAYITNLALEGMLGKQVPRGSIIFISSVRTGLTMKGGAAYEASKHALLGLMRSVAYEYGPKGIRANAIAPGAIYPTGMTSSLTEQDREILTGETPLRRLGTPQDIAQACVFLASDMSSFINGHVLAVDGGMPLGKMSFGQLTPKQ